MQVAIAGPTIKTKKMVAIAAHDRDFVPRHQEVAAEGLKILMIPTRNPESHRLNFRMLRMETTPNDPD
jgi:hypothetical protein